MNTEPKSAIREWKCLVCGTKYTERPCPKCFPKPATGEWTAKRIDRIVRDIDAARTDYGLLCDDYRAITDSNKQLRAQLAAQEQSSWDEIAKLENKLAAAQAAIKIKNLALAHLIGCLVASGFQIRESDRDALLLNYDTTALDAAIAEAIEHELFDKLPCGHLKQFLTRGNVFPQTCMACNAAEAQKPLADALTLVRKALCSGGGLREATDIIDDALAKVGK
jgi:hypothetical protein